MFVCLLTLFMGVLVGSFRCYRMKLLASKNCWCGSSICSISFFLRTLAGGSLYLITLCLVPGGAVELGGSFFGCLWFFKSSVFQVYLFFPANIPCMGFDGVSSVGNNFHTIGFGAFAIHSVKNTFYFCSKYK